jgi:hypothetical protein
MAPLVSASGALLGGGDVLALEVGCCATATGIPNRPSATRVSKSKNEDRGSFIGLLKRTSAATFLMREKIDLELSQMTEEGELVFHWQM